MEKLKKSEKILTRGAKYFLDALNAVIATLCCPRLWQSLLIVAIYYGAFYWVSRYFSLKEAVLIYYILGLLAYLTINALILKGHPLIIALFLAFTIIMIIFSFFGWALHLFSFFQKIFGETAQIIFDWPALISSFILLALAGINVIIIYENEMEKFNSRHRTID
ncbi:MAG: hypothetical protein WC458_00345 [Patescibacteria group bacterium]